MKKALITIATMAASAAFAAGIPQEWAVDVARVKPHQIQAYHGDTMELKATYWLNGAPFDVGGESFRLYWQTNAMEEIYWSADATAASNTVSATFANTMDPGAPIVYGFLGSTGGNYRASFAIRFSPGPGAVPNALPLPAPTIDFDKVEVLNPPWQTPDYSPTNAELVATIEAVAPPADLTPATNYTDSVAGELREGLAEAAQSATNYTDSARASLSTSLAVAAQSATNYTDSIANPLRQSIAEAAQSATNYTDSAIQALPDWAKAATKPSYTLNEVCPSTENWLGVPGTTAAGKSIKVLAKTVNGIVEGGLTVTGSSNNDNNTTKYRYGGVTATRGGVATDYLFDATSQSGVVRRSELAGLATGQSLAAAAQSATNYTDAARASLSTSLAVAAQSATNYTDSSAYDLRLEIAEASFAAQNYTDAAIAAIPAPDLPGKADLNTYTTPEFTTNDLWLCEWSGEVLPLRSGGPMAIWQKAYNAKPALMYIKSPVAWQLNPTGSTLLTITTTNATATALDFGSGYTLKRLTGPAHVVYRDELDRAIAAVPDPDYSPSNAELVATIEAVSPPTDLSPATNYTDRVAGALSTSIAAAASSATNYTDTAIQALPAWAKASSKPSYSASEVGAVPTTRKVNNKALSADITLSASDVGAAPSSLSSTVNTLSGKVGALESWSIGDDTQLKVEHAGETNATLTVLYTNKVMYSTVAAESNTLAKAAAYTDRTALDLANAVDAAMATDAWGDRTSSGAPAPADSLIIEKQKVALTGGGNYSYIESSTGGYWVMAVSLGSQWTLESLADAQNPSNPATVTLYDAEGNAVQTVTTTATREAYAVEGEQYIYCDSSGASDVITIVYPIVADSAPTLLFSPVCTGLDGFDTADQWPSSIASVVASGSSGIWTNTVTMVGHPGDGFFRAKYTKAGQTYTRFNKPLGLTQVVIGDVTYSIAVETINGKKLMVLTEVN